MSHAKTDYKTDAFLARQSNAGVVLASDAKVRSLATEQYEDGYYFGYSDGYAAGKASNESRMAHLLAEVRDARETMTGYVLDKALDAILADHGGDPDAS